MDNSDLIGRFYRNGPDGLVRYRVVSIDEQFPFSVNAVNTLTGHEVLMLADLVRLNVLPQTER